ncbi:tyrosine-type recombinase/integrase [Acetomicrobium mobile]|uniref:tyrosine-type recombinase/integrase n=1 Tax=Acetomicrobium mobile TaxID=97477 RepID=UPI00350E4EC5
MRHAFALSYLRKIGDLLSLQRIMGHTDLAITKRYVAYTLGDIKNSMLRSHW